MILSSPLPVSFHCWLILGALYISGADCLRRVVLETLLVVVLAYLLDFAGYGIWGLLAAREENFIGGAVAR